MTSKGPFQPKLFYDFMIIHWPENKYGYEFYFIGSNTQSNITNVGNEKYC